ncbi:Vegetative incompatibility HET-E-1-like protein [Cladobotryum mycophilum]|uniref:Vegetative incompatibility HET-E-1-like protein n=1 Tax=Cladobotryum mycophilum TaxID=491253 RepID=A0ABR0SAP1_9HYPO
MGSRKGKEMKKPGHIRGWVSSLKTTFKSHFRGEASEPIVADTSALPSDAAADSTSIDTAPTDPIPPTANGINNPPDEPCQSKSLWLKAYELAKPDTRRWIESLPDQNGVSDDKVQVEKLADTVKEIEKKVQGNNLRVKVGEKEVILGDYVGPIMTWITAIGDIAVQFAPVSCSVAWPALRGLLLLPAKTSEENAAILGCTERILSIIRRGKIYEVVFNEQSTSPELLQDLESKLVALYTKVLDLLAYAAQHLKNKYIQILCGIANPSEAKEAVAELIRCETDLARTAETCETARSADADESHTALLLGLHNSVERIDDGVRELLEKIDEREMLDALDYFSSIQFGEQHRKKVEVRTPDTGNWLLKTYNFRKWEQTSDSRILWLQGTVGMGKSFLASTVIDRFRIPDMASQAHDPKNKEGFAYFYCEKGDGGLGEPLSVLQSYVRQLSTVPAYQDFMQKRLIRLYRESRKAGVKLGFDACKEQLFESVNLYPKTTLVLDGLDECDLDSRRRLIEILAELVEKAKNPIKLFISSRPEQDIANALPSDSIIKVNASDNKGDIRKFIEQKMEEIERQGRWKSITPELKNKVKNTLSIKTEGMFRWAYLQMDELSKLHQAKQLEDRLGKLPKTLKGAYSEMLNNMEEGDRETLERAVKWIMCARKPLTSNQLLAAIRLSVGADGATLKVDEKLAEETLSEICHHLIVKDSKRDKWKFPHASVIEYFEEEHRWTMEDAHSFVAKISLLCLINGYSTWEPPKNKDDAKRIDESTIDTSEPQNPASHLHRYVRLYWHQHVLALEKSQSHDVSKLLKSFMGTDNSLQQSSQQYQRWVQHQKMLGDYKTVPHWYDLEPRENPVFGVCGLGFFNILQDWWTSGIDISQVNYKDMDLLSIAARYGHQNLCEKLIDLGSDVNRQLDSDNGSALYQAVYGHNMKITRLLLDKGADPNLLLLSGGYGSALCQAVYGHNMKITRLLLDKGADPNLLLLSGGCGSALECAAAVSGFTETRMFLVKAGASVNLESESGWYGSPLAAAACVGDTEFCRLLIERGADVNAPLKHGEYGSALGAAVFGYSPDVSTVKYLIEEVHADATILSTNPPTTTYFSSGEKNARKTFTKYLVEGGHVEESVLLKIGYPEDEVPSHPDFEA